MGETDFKELLWRQWRSKKRFGGQGITDGGGEEEEYLWKIQHDALLKGVVQSIFRQKLLRIGIHWCLWRGLLMARAAGRVC